LDVSDILRSGSLGFTALIDFIEHRRKSSIIKIARKQPVEHFLGFQYTRARIDERDGSSLWYIYDRNSSIIEKKEVLDKHERLYPIWRGMKEEGAMSLIAKKYTNDHVETRHGCPQFPF
jgi:hypothetical protein